jgi:predicted transcriptional regulator
LLTLLSLADRANKAHGGEAWPSLRDIATRTNRGERQVRSDLRILEMFGWISLASSRLAVR